jgi:hypothetical protein
MCCVDQTYSAVSMSKRQRSQGSTTTRRIPLFQWGPPVESLFREKPARLSSGALSSMRSLPPSWVQSLRRKRSERLLLPSTSMLIRMKVCCRNRLHRVSSSVSGYTSHDLEAAVGCSADRERGCLMDRQFRLGPSRQCDLRSKGYRYFQRGDRTCTTAEPGLQLLGADATLCRTRVRLTNPSSHPSPAAWLWHRQGSVLA